ncbi:MAG: restriction endonuclease subunit R [Acidimicrobiia bacterium]
MVRRVCRGLSMGKQIVVLNDEAHHCYRRRAEEAGDTEAPAEPKLTGDERKEADRREKDAKVWVGGLQAVHQKFGVKTVYDLSATPFFLRGSGYSEGALFPWVVSDFSLIDAIESGIVKIPRVPISDDAMAGTGVTYRDLWPRIRDDLPKKGRRGAGIDTGGEPKLPIELQSALLSLYGNYEQAYRRWEASEAARTGGATPPVFIVVCNNTAVSKLVYDYVAGWEKTIADGATVVVPGELPIFSNVADGRWSSRPNTVLVDSEQLESGDAMSDEFKRVAAAEIDEFKREYEQRFAGRSADDLTDEDLLREVMNTIGKPGKPGKLGEQVKCVVSVSMLTEGWDANTVTHILGVRAFGTQLLCEQVVGRGLRRRSYAVNDDGKFGPEYAEVYGVPFSFIPAAGASTDPTPGQAPTRVRAVDARLDCEITFPRVVGYRYELTADTVTACFTDESEFALSAADVPTTTEIAGIVGESEMHTLDSLRSQREQTVAFHITRELLLRYFRDADGNAEPYLFPQLLRITQRWMRECVVLRDHTFVQLLLLHQHADAAVERIYRAVVRGGGDAARLLPIVRPYDPIGSTRYVDFDTTRPVFLTREDKCLLSHVACDTESWEQKMALALEGMAEVRCYVKNHNLGFTIPYAIDGEQLSYTPDFIARIDTSATDGRVELLNLIVEVSGAQRRDKAEKVATTRDLWVPAVNAHGGFGRWDFIEISDPWDAEHTIRAHLDARERAGAA